MLCAWLMFHSPEIDENQLASVTDADVMDVLEDEDEIPVYKGDFDYSDF
jgi:hypothetical protein